MRDMNNVIVVFLAAFCVMFIALVLGWVMLTLMGWEAAIVILAGSLFFAGGMAILEYRGQRRG